MEINIKPFIKWAGGKTQLLETLKENLPPKNIKIKRYIEAFTGGGALFLDILANFKDYNYDEIIINDINTELINAYTCLKENCDLLLEYLDKLKKDYQSLENLEEKEAFFYEVRKNFNSKTDVNKYLKSAELIFLNKTCFNGLYRENSKGLFNVPFGKHKEPSIFDKNHLKEISILLNLKNSSGKDLVKILNLEFKELLKYIDENTFIYFDPPYRPITKNGFTSYNKSNFNDECQIELAEFCKIISNKNAYFLLSNSDPKNLDQNDDFFDSLYQEFYIQRVFASRRINSKGDKRGSVTEILVRNYEVIEKEIENINNEESNIKIFVESLLETNRVFNFFVDWTKPHSIIAEYEVELNSLNTLIKANDYRGTLKKIISKIPTVVNTFPLLFVLSAEERKKLKKNTFKVIDSGYFNDNEISLDKDLLEYKFDLKNSEIISENEVEDYISFSEKIGIKYLFENLLEKNVVDYVIGCQIGIDTNARKNRSGSIFEKAISPLLEEICKKYEIKLDSQMYFRDLKDKKILNNIANRKADFLLTKNDNVLNIEVNFYNESGSKPEEIIDSYINRKNDLKENGIEFILITDGKGCWGNVDKSQLKKGFEEIKDIFNYNMAKNESFESQLCKKLNIIEK